MIKLAGCVLRNAAGELLLLHRNTGQITQWELPGGKVELDESSETAAIRDVKEELGISVTITGRLGEASFTEGEKEWMYEWFSAELAEKDATPEVIETDTFDELKYWNIETLLARDDLSANMQNLIGSGVLR